MDGLLETHSVNTGNQEPTKSRKRISSEVFPTEEDQLYNDLRKSKMGQEKSFVHVEKRHNENVSDFFT
jgi:hypothetical protein